MHRLQHSLVKLCKRCVGLDRDKKIERCTFGQDNSLLLVLIF